jgi:hypothetical protein
MPDSPALHLDNPRSRGNRSPFIAGSVLLAAAFALNYFFNGWQLPILASLYASQNMELPTVLHMDAAGTHYLNSWWPAIVLVLIALWVLHKRRLFSLHQLAGGFVILGLGSVAMVFVVSAVTCALTISLNLTPNLVSTQENNAKIHAVYTALRIKTAEDKYKQLNPKAGFTCSLVQLRAADALSEVNASSTLRTGGDGVATYKILLDSCSGSPVTKYTVNLQASGDWSRPVSFCIDEEGRLGAVEGSGKSGCLVGSFQ